MFEAVVFPKKWGLTHHQDFLIGVLLEEAPNYCSPQMLCYELYEEKYAQKEYDGMAAPAKLRVLVQTCRDILDRLTDCEVEIEIRRNTGWRITRKHAKILRELIAKEE